MKLSLKGSGNQRRGGNGECSFLLLSTISLKRHGREIVGGNVIQKSANTREVVIVTVCMGTGWLPNPAWYILMLG